MFVCFEGVAGAGKTTQTSLLEEYLCDSAGRSVYTSSAYEKKRRQLAADFMEETGINKSSAAITFLFQALHATQYNEVKSALDNYQDVIADRWRESFFTHHLTQDKDSLGQDREFLDKLDELAYQSLYPDVCILLDLSAEVAHGRYVQREKKLDDGGLDIKPLDYFEDVRELHVAL